MSDSKMQEEYEDWFGKTWPDSAMVAHEHKEAIKLAWNAAWRASRAAVAVELPLIHRDNYADARGYNCAIEAVCMTAQRIEAAGLRVKQ